MAADFHHSTDALVGIISPRMHTEIFSTLLVFLDSTNREIVKSTLGFVKLAVHTLPIETTQPYLKDIVATLSQRLHDHKNHFKEKVRHIFERLIRKFGWDAVYTCAEKDDVSKVLLNIKKRKDRAKRKKVNVDEVEEVRTHPKFHSHVYAYHQISDYSSPDPSRV